MASWTTTPTNCRSPTAQNSSAISNLSRSARTKSASSARVPPMAAKLGLSSTTLPTSARNSLAVLILASWQNIYLNARWIFRRPVNRFRRLLVIRILRFKNVRHKFLRIPVVEREPRALHLHHDAVPLLEHMIRAVQIYLERRHLIRRNRFRLLIRIAVPPAENFVRDHQFEPIQFPVLFHLLRIHINQLHNPIRIRSRRRRKQL